MIKFFPVTQGHSNVHPKHTLHSELITNAIRFRCVCVCAYEVSANAITFIHSNRSYSTAQEDTQVKAGVPESCVWCGLCMCSSTFHSAGCLVSWPMPWLPSVEWPWYGGRPNSASIFTVKTTWKLNTSNLSSASFSRNLKIISQLNGKCVYWNLLKCALHMRAHVPLTHPPLTTQPTCEHMYPSPTHHSPHNPHVSTCTLHHTKQPQQIL